MPRDQRVDYESDEWWFDATTEAGAIHKERCAEISAKQDIDPFGRRCWLARASLQHMASILHLYVTHRPTGPRHGEVLPGLVERASGRSNDAA